MNSLETGYSSQALCGVAADGTHNLDTVGLIVSVGYALWLTVVVNVINSEVPTLFIGD
jgi:hypothetical protein